jgi:hypothetical protein
MAPPRFLAFLLPLAGLIAACSAPYRAPVVVHGSAPFPGIVATVRASGEHPVDVLLVHGMCTHDDAWAARQIDNIAGIVADHAQPTAAATGAIHVVDSTRSLAGGTVRFHALIWSPLTSPLKHQLDYDHTAPPTDCRAAGECKPVRARINGMVKDKLLDDCLSDPLIYEGSGHDLLRAAFVEAIAGVIADNPNGAGTLVVVAESLGSKMLFDALASMLASREPRLQSLGQQASRRLGLLFMAGNQLPMLALAEQAPGVTLAPPQDALQRFLALRRSQAGPRLEQVRQLAIVAFTDPNDLLSYQLLPARYAAPDVAVADVLVSNATTWFGLLENPVTAHLDYLSNPAVRELIACGSGQLTACQ